ncbi:uncharacterized protein J3R85_014327 [Psidium guajava]|nr:uncharacterized protein J3R85_014327 [Psidium guajava]
MPAQRSSSPPDLGPPRARRRGPAWPRSRRSPESSSVFLKSRRGRRLIWVSLVAFLLLFLKRCLVAGKMWVFRETRGLMAGGDDGNDGRTVTRKGSGSPDIVKC